MKHCRLQGLHKDLMTVLQKTPPAGTCLTWKACQIMRLQAFFKNQGTQAGCSWLQMRRVAPFIGTLNCWCKALPVIVCHMTAIWAKISISVYAGAL